LGDFKNHKGDGGIGEYPFPGAKDNDVSDRQIAASVRRTARDFRSRLSLGDEGRSSDGTGEEGSSLAPVEDIIPRISESKCGTKGGEPIGISIDGAEVRDGDPRRSIIVELPESGTADR
jgi:hypothetical protein